MDRSVLSLAELLGLVAFVGLGVATVVLGIWATAAFSLMLGALALALVGIFYRQREGRAFCVGFAFFGAAYLVVALVPWFAPVGQQLVTTRVVEALYQSTDPELAAEAAVRRALEKPAYFEFDDTPLYRVAALIERGYDIDVEVHQSVLDDIGVGAPMFWSAHGIPLRSALKNLFEQLDATYWIANGSLVVGTESAWRRGVKIAPTTDPRVAARFRRGAHSLFALVLAFFGAVVARWCYATRDAATEGFQLSATKVAAAAGAVALLYLLGRWHHGTVARLQAETTAAERKAMQAATREFQLANELEEVKQHNDLLQQQYDLYQKRVEKILLERKREQQP